MSCYLLTNTLRHSADRIAKHCVALMLQSIVKQGDNGVLNIGGWSLGVEYTFTDFYCYVHRVEWWSVHQPMTKSLHIKTVKLCIFTLKSRVVHDTFSNWGDTSCVCKRYKCIWVRKGDNVIMTLECILQYLICTGLHPHGALLVNLPGHRADLKMLSAHIYKHSHSCNYVSLITDKLSTTTLYLELQCNEMRLKPIQQLFISWSNTHTFLHSDKYEL